MATNPVQQHMSFEQYLLLVSNSDRRYEYYDGEVRLMAGGSSPLRLPLSADTLLLDEPSRTMV